MSDSFPPPDSHDTDQFVLDEIEIENTEILDNPTAGIPYQSPVEIIVDTIAWQQINRHVREDMRYESGGILLGEIFEYEDRLTIRITNSVPARGTVNNIATVEFTIDAWRHMDSEREKQTESNKLLGWYHTHPNFSAFFSATDYFMHEKFFTQPWHVALVIDPVQEDYIFYRWDNGQVTECPNFLLQVSRIPDVQYPAIASMVNSISRGLSELTAEEKQSYRLLRKALLGLRDRIQQQSSISPLIGLLYTLIEVNNFDKNAIDEARKLVNSHVLSRKEITLDDLQQFPGRLPKMRKVVIQNGWLLLIRENGQLLILDIAISLGLRHQLKLASEIVDITLDQEATPIFLTSDPAAPLLLMAPNLNIQRNNVLQQRMPKNRLGRLKIDWRSNPQPQAIHSCITGNRVLYLLSSDRMYVLIPNKKVSRLSYVCIASYMAADCGWEHFDIMDWSTDIMGNVFMLDTQKRVVMFDYARMRWKTVTFDKPLQNPRFIATSWLCVTVFDEGLQAELISFDILTLQEVSRIRVVPEVVALGLNGMFTDEGMRLLWITAQGLYLSEWGVNN